MSSQAQYIHGHHGSVLASHAARTAENSCAYFLPRLARGARVLDIGCGPGSISLDLAAHVGPEGQVVAVDFSAEAIAAARGAAKARGDTRTQFVAGDLFDLPFEPGSFDLVHAHQVLQHLQQPVAALQTMARYAKPGGLLAVRDADYGAMSWYPPAPGLDLWRRTYSAAARSLGAEPDAGRRLRAWARAAGLRPDYAGASTWCYASAEATAWWGSSQADRARNAAFGARAIEQGRTAEEVEAIAAAWEAWGADPEAWFLLPHGELIALC